MKLTVEADADSAARATAQRVASWLREDVSARGRCHLALAGGATPRRAYGVLAGLVDSWDGVDLWFGDERALPPDDPQSNYALAAEALLRPAGIPGKQVHRVPVEAGIEAAASMYAAELRERLPSGPGEVPVLDLVLLGIGEDGHVASLFAHQPGLETRGRACVAVHDAPKLPRERVTLTLDVLRAARRVLVLATGAGKAGAVAAALAGPDPAVPASLLAGAAVELIVDPAAAPAEARV